MHPLYPMSWTYPMIRSYRERSKQVPDIRSCQHQRGTAPMFWMYFAEPHAHVPSVSRYQYEFPPTLSPEVLQKIRTIAWYGSERTTLAPRAGASRSSSPDLAVTRPL